MNGHMGWIAADPKLFSAAVMPIVLIEKLFSSSATVINPRVARKPAQNDPMMQANWTFNTASLLAKKLLIFTFIGLPRQTR